jgi:TatA/E family protein of Tat protein translocase
MDLLIFAKTKAMLLFFNLGGGEIFFILLFVLIFFGSKKIPEVARGLGKGIRQFKDAAEGIQRDIQDNVSDIKEELDVRRQMNIEKATASSSKGEGKAQEKKAAADSGTIDKSSEESPN